MERCGLGRRETDAIFAEADLNGDASLSFEEFTALMRECMFRGASLTHQMLYGPI